MSWFDVPTPDTIPRRIVETRQITGRELGELAAVLVAGRKLGVSVVELAERVGWSVAFVLRVLALVDAGDVSAPRYRPVVPPSPCPRRARHRAVERDGSTSNEPSGRHRLPVERVKGNDTNAPSTVEPLPA